MNALLFQKTDVSDRKCGKKITQTVSERGAPRADIFFRDFFLLREECKQVESVVRDDSHVGMAVLFWKTLVDFCHSF